MKQYRILRKIKEGLYEDFGVKSTKKDAIIVAKASAIILGYQINDYVIEEEERETA